jgi:outer membrane receptor protein involved in Fe transport
LSKYVLDYTRHAIGAQAAIELPARYNVSARADYRRRSDLQRYTLIDARVSKRIKRAMLFVEGSNLLDETYTEIAGVAMPGRAAMAGVTVR